MMGRLPKAKVDKIIEMLKQGYTFGEIEKKVGCSVSTISRIKSRREAKPETVRNVSSLIMIELVKTVYQILEIMYLSCGVDQELIQPFVSWLSQDLTEKIMRKDPELGKLVLEESGYYEGLIVPMLTKKLLDIDENLRRGWIDLLKKYWPQKLAQIIK